MREYVHREVEPVLLGLLQQFPAVAITGPRQSGKSTTVRQILPAYAYCTLDNPLHRRQAREDPELLLNTLGARAVIDEVQYAPSLLTHIKMRIDSNRDQPGQFVVTGSQQFSMMKDLGESLAGRIAILELLPFSLSEKQRVPRLSARLASPLTGFSDACLTGSFPEPVLRERMDAERWHSAYLQTYLERDIRTIFDIGNLHDFERCLMLLAACCAQVLNMSVLARELGVAVNTVRRWLSVLEACRFVYLLPPYYSNLGKRITQAPKVYFLDCGFVCHLSGIREERHLLQGPMGGALFENYCIQEAVKSVVAQGRRPRFYYLRTHGGTEVDLLVEGANRSVWPFEFKLSQTPRRSMADALGRFRRAFGELKPENGAVVSLSESGAPLTREVELVTVPGFLERVRAAAS